MSGGGSLHLQVSTCPTLHHDQDASSKQSNCLLLHNTSLRLLLENECVFWFYYNFNLWWFWAGVARLPTGGAHFSVLASLPGADFSATILHSPIGEISTSAKHETIAIFLLILITLCSDCLVVCIPNAPKGARQIMGRISYSTFCSSDFRIYWR